jgi:tellurium resistance protein TerD
VSTWWSLAPRADLGLMDANIAGTWARPFAITNRGWYLLYRFLFQTGNAHTVHLMCEREAFIPTRIAVQWGRSIESTTMGDWYLVGQFNGHAVVASGIVHAKDIDTVDMRSELTPLPGTGVYQWLMQIGTELSTAPSGYLVTGKPRKGSSMSQSITKGEKVDLGKAVADAGAPAGLGKVRIGLGWDARTAGDGKETDLDAVVIACDANGKAVSEDWRIFFNNKVSPGNAITHSGDNLTGVGDGDDETVIADLAALPAEVESLEIYVTLYEAGVRGLNFGLVDNAFVRIVDDATGTELCRFDLSEDAGANTSLHFAKVYRNSGTWAFKALGTPQKVELDGVFAAH